MSPPAYDAAPFGAGATIATAQRVPSRGTSRAILIFVIVTLVGVLLAVALTVALLLA